MSKNIMITGGAGFIGSHVIRWFVKNYPDYTIYNLDALTYAGNLENVSDLELESNYNLVNLDIRNLTGIRSIFQQFDISHVIHLAAESHVDRSIEDPFVFIETNVNGTANLLQAAREAWQNDQREH